MNHGQIKQILAIFKHMSLTAAARELYITQPALSHSLAKAEEELGVHLFYRDGNRIYSTQEGKGLLEQLKRIDEEFENLYALATSMSAVTHEQITIGFSGSVLIFSSMFITGFLTSYKGMPIHKVFADPEQIAVMLNNGEIDLAITYPPIRGKQIGTHILYEDQIVLAASSRHPLASRRTVAAKELVNYRMHMLTRDNPFRRSCDELLDRRQITISGQEHDYAQFVELLEKSRFQDDFLTFTTKNSFDKWYGEGFSLCRIEDAELKQVTAVSWLLESGIQFRYKELLDMIEQEYCNVYDNSMYHSFLIKDFAT